MPSIGISHIRKYKQRSFVCSHPKVLTPGRWWKIHASRVGKVGKIQVDKEPVATSVAPGTHAELNVDGSLFLGSLDPAVTSAMSLSTDQQRGSSSIPRILARIPSFTGVLQRIFINGEPIPDPIRAARKLQGVRRYRGPPCHPNPCQNGGSCSPILANFHCSCPEDYTGKSCQERKPINE